MIQITHKESRIIEVIKAPEGLSSEEFIKLAEDYLIFREKNPNDYIIEC